MSLVLLQLVELTTRAYLTSVVAVWRAGAVWYVTGEAAPAGVTLADVSLTVARAVTSTVEVRLIRIARAARYLAVGTAVPHPRVAETIEVFVACTNVCGEKYTFAITFLIRHK